MKQRYHPKELYEAMKFPIISVKSGSVYGSIPELQRYPEFKLKLPKKKLKEGEKAPSNLTFNQSDIIRYVAFVYDKNSPYQEQKNINKRKTIVMEDIGWKHDKEGNWDDVRHGEMMALKIPEVNRMIVRHIRLEHDLGYARLVSGLELYYDNIEKIAENTGDDALSDNKSRQGLFKEMEQMQINLDDLAEEVFSGDRELMHTAYEINEEEKKDIVSYPEYIANLRDEGKF